MVEIINFTWFVGMVVVVLVLACFGIVYAKLARSGSHPHLINVLLAVTPRWVLKILQN